MLYIHYAQLIRNRYLSVPAYEGTGIPARELLKTLKNPYHTNMKKQLWL